VNNPISGVRPGQGVHIEPLEARQLLAATPPAIDADHVLHVRGTDGSDRIVVSRILAHHKDEVKVVLNKRKFYFRSDQVTEIDIDSGADRDYVAVDPTSATLNLRLRVDAGAGGDTLVTASGDDILLGGAGDDSLMSARGADYLEGGDGNDTLLGGKGDDNLVGAAGNDSLIDDLGDNDFNGGAGRDNVKRGITGPDQFVIGVWSQPSGSAWKWKQRGVNTMVHEELMGGRIPLATWDAEVIKNGMNMIRQPSKDPADDAGNRNLLAWLAPDEPDGHHTDPAVTSAFYSRLKKINPNLPVFMNFSGGHVVGYQEKNWKHPYAAWLEGADWAGSDIYPVAGWNQPKALNLVGKSIDRLRAIAPEKPQFAFIETSDQGLPWLPDAPGPTPDQFRAEIWNAVIHGARGIIYFPQQFKPGFNYNATPPDVEAEMIKQDATLKDLSGVLLSRLDPKGYHLELPPGVEGTVRTWKGKTYLIALNLNHRHVSNARIKITGVKDGPATVYNENRTVQIQGGEIVDTFEGYTPHIYVIG
jgi:hypothetical protein